MKTRITVAVLALALMPGFAVAQCMGDHIKTSSQCGDGKVWDNATQSCTTPVHS